MADIEIPLVGPTYTNRALSVSNQLTQNYYVEVNQGGDEIVSLQPFWGLKSWGTSGSGKNRGMGELSGVLYTVSGTELYSVDSNGSGTLIGTIEGTNRCNLEPDNSGNLIITTGIGKPYSYNGTTLSQGTDSDLPNAATVAYINERVIYDSSTGLSFADLNTPLTVNSANVLNAVDVVDTTLAVIAHKQQILTFGSKSIEPNYFTGSGNPPYALARNAVQRAGTSATYSVSGNNDHVYFLDKLRQPSRTVGLAVQTIGNPAIGQAIRKYADVSDCFTVCFSFDNQNFCMFSFPSANESWLFNEEAQLWTTLAHGTGGDQHLMSDHIFIYGKHLVSDRRNGSIYELDSETYTDNSLVIQRKRQTAAIDSRDIGLPKGRIMTMNSLTLEIEKGVSLVSAEATIIMEYSDDHGHTWSSERWQTIGEQGDYTREIEWLGLGDFKSRMFRFTMSDPVNWVLTSMKANVEVGFD